MKVDKILGATALALIMNNICTTSTAFAQEANTLTNETCSVEFINQYIEQSQSTIEALIKSIELMPECTESFVKFALSNNNTAAVETVLAAVNTNPEQVIDIVVVAIQALPDQKDVILGAVLDTIDDLSTRIDIIYAAYGLSRISGEEVIAELEEVDEPVEEIAELEEAAAPTAPPPPAFNPGANDKPAGISPT